MAIDAGGEYTCALASDGTVVCWGWNFYSQCNAPAPPAGQRFIAASAGVDHMCALASDGTVVCWGSNSRGQCSAPAPPAEQRFTAVSAGGDHTCALLSNGTVVCWGWNNQGQCSAPAPPVGQRFTAVSAGRNHTCALLSNGTVVCWGRNHKGQCSAPAPPAGQRFTAVSAGGRHTCALASDGTVVCWGRNDAGRCSAPAPPAGQRFTAVSAGGDHSCALASDGTVACWGDNYQGQCSTPAPPVGQRFIAVSAGCYHTCALASDGTVVCWGLNDCGQCNAPAPPAGHCYVVCSHAQAALERTSKRLKLWQEQPDAPWWDVKLVADDGTEVHASRSDLAVCSAYFERLLCNDGAFADTALEELPVPGASGHMLREVTAHMHGKVALELERDSVDSFLEAGDRLQAESIKQQCCGFLERRLSPITAVATHLLAVRHSCEGLQAACAEYFAKHLAEVAAQTPAAQLQALREDELRGILQCTGADCCSAALDVVAAWGGPGATDLAEWQLQRVPLEEWQRGELRQVHQHPLARNCFPFVLAVMDFMIAQEAQQEQK